jgi:tetratricopeptide (TPR) repeat protein
MDALINNRYKIVSKLGEGGMGEVYLVEDTIFQGKRRALKILKGGGRNPDHFKGEFKILSKLRHPNLVEVYDFGLVGDGPQLFYTYEFIEGKNLFEIGKDLPYDDLYEILVQVLRALEYIHSKGLIHYDIKPENVLIQKESTGYRAKLVDFGLAGEERTRDGTRIKGTVHYLAPEMAKEGPVDRRADLYSLGISLYYVVTGRLPYSGRSNFSIIKKHLGKIPDPPRSINPKIPEVMQKIILKLIAKDPSERYSSANEVIRELRDRTGRPFQGETTETVASYLLTAKFVGRKEEFARLDALLQPIYRPDGAGSVALLRGERGVGKTRLLQEFKVHCQLRGVPFFIGGCREGGTSTLGPLGKIVRQVAALEQLYRGRLPEAESERFRKLKGRYREVLGLFLTGPETRREGQAISSMGTSGERLVLMDRLAEYMVRVSCLRPYVVALEDIQLADDMTRNLLLGLVRNIRYALEGEGENGSRAGGVPKVILLLSCHAAEADEEVLSELLTPLAEQPFFLDVDLKRLSMEETAELVGSMLALRETPPRLISAIYEKTGGNPFFVQEILKSLVEDSVVDLRKGLTSRGEKALHAHRLPRSLEETVTKRVAKASPQARSILAVLSACSGPVSLEVIRHASGLGPEEASEALLDLCRREIIARAEEMEGLAYRFSHGITKEVISRSIPRSDCLKCCLRAAEAIEKVYETNLEGYFEELARLYMEGEKGSKALSYSLRAGEQALAGFALERAAECFEAARRLLEEDAALDPSGERMRGVLGHLGRIYGSLARYDLALERFRSLLRLAKDDGQPFRQADILHEMGWVNLNKGLCKTGADCFRQGLDLLSEPADMEARAERGRLLTALGRTHLWKGEYGHAIRNAGEGLELLRETGRNRDGLRALNVLTSAEYFRGNFGAAARFVQESLKICRENEAEMRGLLKSLGIITIREHDYTRAIEYLEHCREVRREIGDSFGITISFSDIGTVYDLKGELASKLLYYRRSLRIYEKMGDSYGVALSFNNLGSLMVVMGNYGKALNYYKRYLAINEKTQGRAGIALALHNLGIAYGFAGGYTEAEALLKKGLRLAEELGMFWMTGYSHQALGRTAMERDPQRFSQSEKELDRAEAVFREIGNKKALEDVLLDQVALACGRGRFEKAERLLEDISGRGDEEKCKDSLCLGHLLKGRLCLHKGAPEAALDSLGEALRLAEEIRFKEIILRVHHILGKALWVLQRLGEADEHFRQALAIQKEIYKDLPGPLRKGFLRSRKARRLRDESLRLTEELLSKED